MTILHDELVERPFDEPPDAPAKPDWKVAFSRARTKFSQDGCTDVAAALTYYSVQSIFPGLIAMVSLLNLFGNGKSTTTSLVNSIGRIVGKSPSDLTTVTNFINNVQTAKGGGIALIIGIGGALWSASGYVGAFGRSLNRIYAVGEWRSFVKLKGTLLLVTAIELVLLVVAAMAIVVSGPIAKEVGSAIGLGSQAVTVWDWVKWPFVMLIVIAIISMLYWATPNVRKAKRSLLTWGAFVGFAVWVAASLALFAYIEFTKGASYQKTYGAFAGVIIFLLWLWITNLALLFGAELDAELLRTRQLKSGLPAERLVLLPAKSTDKEDKQADKDEQQVEEAHALRESASPAKVAESQRGTEPQVNSFGESLDQSQHGSLGTPTAPADQDAEIASRSAQRRAGDRRSAEAGSAAAIAGSSGQYDPEASRARVEAKRLDRRDAALQEAERNRRTREKIQAQEARAKKAQERRQKRAEEARKQAEASVTREQRWAAVEAVRAQYDPQPSAARDAIEADRSQRRSQFQASVKEAANKPPTSQQDKGSGHRSGAGSTAVEPDKQPTPSVYRDEVEAERERRRDEWYAARGM